MTCEHKLGEVVSQFYVGKRNKDSTEGRGPMIDVGAFDNHEDAYKAVKGMAPMGCGDGDVYQRTYYRCTLCPEIVRVDTAIYYGDDYTKKNILGGDGVRSNYMRGNRYVNFMPDGWRTDYSPLADDPEYKEYLRLKQKYGDK